MSSGVDPLPRGGRFSSSKSGFDLLFAHHPFPMFICDLDTLAFVDVNEAGVNSFGYSRGRLLTLTMLDVLSGPDKDRLQDQLTTDGRLSLLRSRKWRIIAGSGEVREVHTSARIFEYDGRRAVLISVKDAWSDEAIKVRDDLELSESELRAVFAAMQDVLLVIDREGIYRKVASRSVDYLYLPPSQLVGSRLQEIFPAAQAQSFLTTIHEVLDSQKASRIEYELKINGKNRWFSTSIIPMGADVTLWVARDITDLKNSELALRQSGERYHSLFDRMMDGVYRSTHEGRFVEVNPAMVRMFGYSSREEMLAVDIKKDLYFSAEERGSHVLDTGQEEVEAYRMRRKDGSEIWVEDHGSYVHDADGKLIYHEGILRDITDRRKREEFLARLQKAVDSSNDAIFMSDLDGVFTYVNPAFTQLYGYSPEELVGKATPRVIKSGIYGQDMYQNFWAKITSGHDVSGEIVNKTRDGRLITVAGSASPIFDDSHSAVGYLGIQRDVTARKKAEEALRVAEANYRSIFENATIGIYQSTKTNGFISVNPVMARIFGYSSPQEMVASVRDIARQYYVDPADRQRFEDLITAQGEVREFVSHNYRRDGSRIWVQENARVVRDEAGQLLYYEGFVTDITERVLAEEVLKESESRFRHMADATPVMMWMSGPDGVANYFNKAWLEFTGRSMEQELGDGWTEGIHPADRPACIAAVRESVPLRRVMKLEYRMRAANGSYRWIMDHGVPRFSENGEFFGYIGSCVDVSDFKQAEQELHRANDSLIEAHRELEQMLSHEQVLSRTDGLTGLFNYRHFFELASHEFEMSLRYKRPLSIIIFDLDKLKQVNDTFGHQAGDRMLLLVAQTAAAQIRSLDALARYGGDEFVILLPHTNLQMAASIAERIRASLAALQVPTECGPLQVTLSIGVADLRTSPADDSVEQVVQRADQALYTAKQSGRNQVAVFPSG